MDNYEMATIFANACNNGASNDTLHLYNDGYVLTTAASVVRQQAICQMLIDNGFESNRAPSDDGFLSAWVIPCNLTGVSFEEDESEEYVPPVFAVITESFHDHRQEEHDTIEAAAVLLAGALAIAHLR